MIRLQSNSPKNFIALKFDVTNIEQIESAKDKVAKKLDGEPLTANAECSCTKYIPKRIVGYFMFRALNR